MIDSFCESTFFRQIQFVQIFWNGVNNDVFLHRFRGWAAQLDLCLGHHHVVILRGKGVLCLLMGSCPVVWSHVSQNGVKLRHYLHRLYFRDLKKRWQKGLLFTPFSGPDWCCPHNLVPNKRFSSHQMYSRKRFVPNKRFRRNKIVNSVLAWPESRRENREGRPGFPPEPPHAHPRDPDRAPAHECLQTKTPPRNLSDVL